ncbi:MAG: MarR family winged helix-turn-helix transcriptional regulator [Bacillota bacterium]
MDSSRIHLFREKLRQFERDIGWHLKSETGCCGVSIAQCQILLEIARKKEVSIVELAAALGLDASTLSRTINNMVDNGLVNRMLNPGDRRYVSLTLTEQGEKVTGFMEEVYDDYIGKIFEFIPEEKREQALESFLLIADAVNRCNQSFRCCPEAEKVGKE